MLNLMLNSRSSENDMGNLNMHNKDKRWESEVSATMISIQTT